MRCASAQPIPCSKKHLGDSGNFVAGGTTWSGRPTPHAVQSKYQTEAPLCGSVEHLSLSDIQTRMYRSYFPQVETPVWRDFASVFAIEERALERHSVATPDQRAPASFSRINHYKCRHSL
jgi:hypothetical protein